MRKLIVHEFITLDGVIQAPGGETEDMDGGFTHGGWTRPFWHDQIGEHFGQVLTDTDALLLGAKTWRIHGEAFAPNPAYDPFGSVHKYVASRKLSSVALWANSSLLGADVVASVRALKSQPGKNILLDGSSVLLQSLIANDLVDEYMLHVYPLVLGGGKRLFPAGKTLNLTLLESSVTPTGVVYQRYQAA